MGQRKMGRDVRIGWVEDPLRLYEKHYRLSANCRRPRCEHKRARPVALLTRLFPLETTIGEIATLLRVPAAYPGFIEPCRPMLKERPPEGGHWIHEIKHDGYRLQLHRHGCKVALYTRGGYDWSERFPSVAEDVKKLVASDAILDGELVVQNARGIAAESPF